MQTEHLKKFKLPKTPGVYFFLSGKDILYIGKATTLRSRVKSYFGKNLIVSRGQLLVDMVGKANKIDWQPTDSVLEALILEASLIKKYKPKYNTQEKSDKSFNYVCITKEALPKILVIRGRELAIQDYKFQATFGPFTNGSQLEEAMKIVRRIFPYIDASSSKRANYEFYKQLGLTPNLGEQRSAFLNGLAGVKDPGLKSDGGQISEGPEEKHSSVARVNYLQNIKYLKLFFKGKKKDILKSIKKEMMQAAKLRQFERAGELKRQLFALQHINDIALLKHDNLIMKNSVSFRIEAYDIAHMSGKNMVGVMTVVENGEVVKSEYKKFKIRTQSGANDTGALLEVLERRFNHKEWQYPNLVVVDGSVAQINVARSLLKRLNVNIPVASVVKDERHKAKAIQGDEVLISKYKSAILLANSEAHRFAINYHKNMRNKNFLGNFLK